MVMSNMSDLSAETDGLKHQARQALFKAGDQISEQAYHVRDFGAEVRYNVEDFIQSKPWQAVAIAAGIGFVFGVVVGSRRR
jgi:ElaB/YqjD/DUF883 family membrane-anchored ribosome-binding protein